jgi:protein-L-isoaspartate(D-aspartate) O-methyltransferase
MDGSGGTDEAAFVEARQRMVEEQIARRGIKNPRVLAAMQVVPRHRFVAPALAGDAYEDRPLPIGFGQTISQPYMVALATELLDPQEGARVLEVGSGCGYQAAVLARLAARVYAVEIIPGLAEHSRRTLAMLDVTNVVVDSFDGGGGWPEHAPYDAIVVSAGAPRVPPLLVDQLADGGRLVVPVGPREEQTLAVVRRVGDRYETREDTRCRYVDLLGRYGVGAEPPSA